MKKLYLFLAMALTVITLQSTFPSTAAADTISIQTLLSPMLLAEVQTDNTTTEQPVEHRTTWGALKAIYRGTTPVPYSAERAQESAAQIRKPVVTPNAVYTGVDWSNNVFSEACYTLNVYRTGSSNVVYKGIHLSDWDYVHSDNAALNAMTSYIGGTVNRGTIDGTYGGGHLGGYCKFFVDLVLYRSSYGIGNGWHLVLPGGGYDYSSYMTPYDITQAKTGWVIQRGGTKPHSAIVAANLGWGLDLIDSNNVDFNGSFVIARHSFTWAQLSGYTAYKPTYMKQF